MKKILLLALLCAALLLMSGCTAVDQAVGRLREDGKPDTPQAAETGIDWSFVPGVRDLAVKTFTDAFPDATVSETSVATRSGDSARVIVTLTFEMDGKTGTYGFDYEKDDAGNYVLVRYGDGVDSGDL